MISRIITQRYGDMDYIARKKLEYLLHIQHNTDYISAGVLSVPAVQQCG